MSSWLKKCPKCESEDLKKRNCFLFEDLFNLSMYCPATNHKHFNCQDCNYKYAANADHKWPEG